MRRLPSLFLSALMVLALVPSAALAHGGYADPGAVTVGPDQEFASWTGGPYSASTVGSCPSREDTGSNVCDYLEVQVPVDGKFWGSRDGNIEIVISWDSPTPADFDLTVFDGTGEEVAEAAAGGAGPERVKINEPTGAYTVRVTPWQVAAPTSYEGTITFTSAEAEADGSTSGVDVDFTKPLRDEPCVDGLAAEAFACEGYDLAAFLPIADIGGTASDEVSDIWGWTDPETGAEIAIVGLISGTVFVDISDPLDPVVLAKMANNSLTPSIWHDFKVLGNFVYAGSESNGHDLQIVDLTRLRELTGDTIETIEPDATVAIPGAPGDTHNLATNEATGRLYSVGTNLCDGGPVVFDTDDEGASNLDPTFLGCIAEDGYTHDTQCVVYAGPDVDHTGKEICVNSNEDTMTVVDVTEVGLAGQNTVQLSRTGYDTAEYSHQGWFTEDQRYFLLGDELDEQRDDTVTRTTTYIFDMLDLDAPVLLNAYEHATASIDHNLYTLDDRVYMSNYTAGLRVMDLARVSEGQLDEVAFFDTYPLNDDAVFNGTWSNYPYFESGAIPVTGIDEGLFVLTPVVEDVPVPEPTDPPTEPTDPPTEPTDPPTPPSDTPSDMETATPAQPVEEEPTDESSEEPSTTPSPAPSGVEQGDEDEDEPQELSGRVAGRDRFVTAAELSRRTFAPGVDVAYVATGRGFADALAGGALAAANDAPILLVEKDGVPDATATELLRLEPGRIVVLGGELAVAGAVRDQLRVLTDGDVTRLSGADRYATATAIAEAFPDDVDEVLVATGRDFPDALAGGALAASRGAPIILTEADALPTSVRRGLTRLSPMRATLLGGLAVVSDDVAAELSVLTGGDVPRLAGADRFATMAAIVRAYDPAPTTVFIATGLDFPDALTAVPAVAAVNGALLLVRTDDIPAVTQELLDDLDPDRLVVVGGTSAVTQAVENQLRSARR